MPELFDGARVLVRMPSKPRVLVERPTGPKVRITSSPFAWRAALAELTAKLAAAERGEQAFADVRFTGGTIAGINGTPVPIDGACVVLPPSDTPQVIRFTSPFNITVTGAGYFTLQLYDYTGGVAMLKRYRQRRILATDPVTAAGDLIDGFYRQPPHSDYRVMQVYFTLSRDIGSSLQMGVPNLDNEYTKSVVQVVKE